MVRWSRRWMTLSTWAQWWQVQRVMFVKGEVLLGLHFGNLIEFGSHISFLSAGRCISLDHLVCQSSSTDARLTSRSCSKCSLVQEEAILYSNRISTVLPQTVIRRQNYVTNETVYQMTGQQPLSATIHQRQLRWLDHVLRKPLDELIPQYALYQPLHGKRRRGRPQLLYPQYIARQINRDDELTPKEIIHTAQEKANWTRIVTKCSAADGWCLPLFCPVNAIFVLGSVMLNLVMCHLI